MLRCIFFTEDIAEKKHFIWHVLISIPFDFLIDFNRKILVKNLRGYNLSERIFKYINSKYYFNLKESRMKKALILLSIMLIALCVSSQNISTFKGKVHKLDSEKVVFVKNLATDEGEEIKVQEDGTFSFSTSIDQPEFDAAFVIGYFIFKVYVEPNRNYIVNMDLSVESDESRYNVLGDNLAENVFLKEYNQNFAKTYQLLDPLQVYDNFKDYNSSVSKLRSIEEGYLAQIDNPRFVREMKNRIKKNTLYYNYVFAFNWLKKNGEIVNDPDFDKYLLSEEWTGSGSEDFSDINTVLNYYIIFNMPEVDLLDIMKTMKKCLSNQDVLNQESTNVMGNILENRGKGDIGKMMKYYREICNDGKEIERIAAVRSMTKKLEIGALAPDFEMKDLEGNMLHLSDLKGKALFIDVWATWCGPCKLEIPHFKKIADHYKENERIRFISISIDENSNAWKKLLLKEKPEWAQYIVDGGNESALYKKYQISSIPRFMFFDKDGKIVSIRAPYPSDDDVLEYINSHL